MHFRAAPLIVLIAATSACGAGSGPVTTDAPTPFSASSTSTPERFTAAECRGAIGGTRVILRLDVPKEFEPESTGPTDQTPGGQCTWRTSEDRFFSVRAEPLALQVAEGVGRGVDQRLDDLEAVLDSIELIRA